VAVVEPQDILIPVLGRHISRQHTAPADLLSIMPTSLAAAEMHQLVPQELITREECWAGAADVQVFVLLLAVRESQPVVVEFLEAQAAEQVDIRLL
jgi:hypothetical protein